MAETGRVFPLLLTTVLLINFFCGNTLAQQVATTLQSTNSRQMRCIPGGVQLVSSERIAYEICADNFCRTFSTPQVKETIRFPPHVVLHAHHVLWKFLMNDSIEVVDVVCAPASFCDQIDCLLCSATIFNPECWPLGAIFATTFILYLILTGCYVFLYVPMVIGKPVRVIASLLWRVIAFAVRKFGHACRKFAKNERNPTFRSRDIVELLAIGITIGTVSGCQQLNLFSHKSTVCSTTEGNEVCKVHISEVLKINAFKREACFKLLRNSTTIHEIRALWKGLILTCEPEHELFTRDTRYNVVDSKRCPHTGSCVGAKCASINSSSLVPELNKGNGFPGVTTCVESCGGPGCDCFYWSSGCLFYRIYLTPTSPQVFEIFHCNRWVEAAKVKFTHVDTSLGRTFSYTAFMRPNVPIKWKIFTITLTSVTVPPIPLLNSAFITDGNSTALWDSHLSVPLRCPNRTAAKTLACEVVENCKCFPAENHANCKCVDTSVSPIFNDLRNRLPAVFPSVSFKIDNERKVQAVIPSMTTSEVIISIQDNVKTNVMVDDNICSVGNSIIFGCYNCAKGAEAQISCSSSRKTQAEISCDSASFTVDCDPQGALSTLRFSLSKARIHLVCSVSCGAIVTKFELGGILKFTQTAHGMLTQWLQGSSDFSQEFQWPDISHIAEVFMQWYKTVLLAIILLAISLGITYCAISLCGFHCAKWLLKFTLKVLRYCMCLFFRPFIWICTTIPRKFHKKLL
ncbi:hypothetical protein OESDEN_12267 [Oesophagostomum dentatum]|uniref:Phlebovirus glycoprotein G2 fusion domain-containing protein n=1 Tax=Oesophagostomum dentatum TaxID=61180 RepID=A0A0B1SWP5_OESDE|nr:hypothetical protein OESDEN_12267 [Oesophagostomum dentatum]